MPDQLDALLGLDMTEEDQTRALAEQLRRKERIEGFFAASSRGNIAKSGERGLDRIYDTAKSTGDRRYQQGRDVVSDARNVGTDKRLDQARSEASAKHDLTMRTRGKAEPFKDADGNIINLQRGPGGTYRDSQGNPVDLAGLTPYDKYAQRQANKRFADKKDKYGNAYNYDDDYNMIFADGTPWEEDEAFRRSQRSLDQETTGAGTKKFNQEQAELSSEFIGDAFKSAGTNRRIQKQMDSALSLIEQGAGTGAIEEDLLTIKDVTKALESLQADIGLERIGPLKLTPVSDVDLRKVFETSIPLGIDSEGLKTWLKFKRESFGILAEIQDYTYDTLQGNGGVMPTGPEKKVMDDHIEKLMNTGEYGLVMPNLKTGEVQSREEAPEAATTEPDAGGFIYQTLPDGTRQRKKVR